MALKEKRMSGYENTGIIISKLTSEQVASIMSELGTGVKMTALEAQEFSKNRMPGESLAEEIIKMRNEE